ncbi:hypothetical protein H2259_00180 [Campylobacter sp. RM10532]|uniref:hypothetical protein n=1 Tax=Campylobacter molothri TaxID=1032242 RepID=UPI00301DCF75|nr:hypothetical protein [Campylobacter sp. RM10532]
MEEKEYEVVNNLLNLDFNGCENIFSFHELIKRIEQNENNIKYKNSINFLYYFYNYIPDCFKNKYKQAKLKKEYLKPLNNIIHHVKNPLLQLKLVTVLLLEYQDVNKPDIAKLIVKNTILFLNKLFDKNAYELREGVLFACDLNYIFQLEEDLKYIEKLKDIINNYLYSKESKDMDFGFIRLFESLITRYKYFYNKDELNIIISKLYEIIEAKTNYINTINEDFSLQLHKNLICGIYGILVLIDQHNKTNIYQKIIDINLLVANKIKDSAIKTDALAHALKFSNKTNNKKQISKINLLIQENNKNLISNFKPIEIDIPLKAQQLLENFKNEVDDYLKNNSNLFSCVLKFYPYFKTNFEKIEGDDFIELFFPQTIRFDEDCLLENIDDSGLFRNYNNHISASYLLINILKPKLLQKFYPSKEYFYSLTYDNNIIPKGYEEVYSKNVLYWNT